MIGGLVGAGIAAYVLNRTWRRFRYVHARWRNDQKAVRFEQALRRARAEASTAGSFRLADERDRGLLALLAGVRAEAECAGFVACGFQPLADLVADSATGTPTRAAMRMLVDEAGTVFAAVGVSVTAPDAVRVSVSSYAVDAVYVSARGPQVGLAEPPFVHRQRVAASTSHADLLAKHRSLVAPVVGKLLACTTSDALIGTVTRLRAQIAEWREAQPPDALLDADLRHTLGGAYDRTGKVWARRLRDELPQAHALPGRR